MNALKMASIFDGSGTFPLGAFLQGIQPVWASEIEPFPIRVTTKRLPFMKHYGNIRHISGANVEPVDIISMGSPCTNVSCSGRREGLYGKESILFFEAIRVIREMREASNEQKPRFIVFENVPGLWSSGGPGNKGGDFRKVLEEIVQIKDQTLTIPMPENGKWMPAGEIVGDGFSVAYRGLRAEYWGVPQRRYRIFLVADLNGECAGKVLFESEGLSGYTPQGTGERQDPPGNPETGAGTSGRICSFEPGAASRLGGHVWEDMACTLRTDMGDNQLCIILESHPADNRIKLDTSGTVQTLTNRMGTGGSNTPLVLQAYGICSNASHAMQSLNPSSGFYEAETSRTLDRNGGDPSHHQGGLAIVMTIGSFCHVHTDDIAPTILNRDYKNPPVISRPPEYIVRKLMPKECALLMGMDPSWCDDLETPNPSEAEIDWWYEVFETHRKALGKTTKPRSRKQVCKWLRNPYTDAAEFRMWGSGVVLQCVRFIMAGIVWAANSHPDIST